MKKISVYYLIRDILSTFTASTDIILIDVFNKHYISKEIIKLIFKDEISSNKPSYSIIRGSLIVQCEFLRQFPQSAFFEIIEVLDELKYCLKKDKRITINKLSAQVIFRLFATLYFEFIMLPMHHKDDIQYINIFMKYFSKEDIFKIMRDGFLTRFVFQQHGIDLGCQDEVEINLNRILSEFYQISPTKANL